MALEPGTTLGSFEIAGLLGVGGMGEVYRARDLKLGREVAVKVLPEAVAADAERMARFEREAQMLASLDHPNIGALYEFRHEGGVHFLVMQLVEGETLSERLARGRMSVEEAVPIFVQIAQALEAAHDRGIVHRDLKPANVKLTDGDKVKVLDFGLAKSFLDEEPTGATPTPSGPDATTLPATPSPPRSITGTAMLVGTPSYMSPEQARGKRVDKRTDIWAFGCVLYEALTGRKAYEGETIADTVSAIIHKEVDWDALPGNTPQRVRELLERCVRKDLNTRARDIGDVRVQLNEALSGPPSWSVAREGGPTERAPRRSPFAIIVALIVGAAIAGGSVWFLRPAEPEAPVRRFDIVFPEDAPLASYSGTVALSFALSADGRLFVYTGDLKDGLRLYLRNLETGETRAMPGTENGYAPFFSPDGEWVAYFDYSEKTLKKVPVRGGIALTIADASQGRGGAWGPDGRIVYSRSTNEGLWMVSASGGSPEQITGVSEKTSHRWPSFLPDGEHVIFAITVPGNGSLRIASVGIVSLRTGETKILLKAGGYPHYAASGHIVYAFQDALMAVPFDFKTLRSTGPAGPVVDELSTLDLYGAAWYALSENGTLLYSQGVTMTADAQRLVWVSLDGEEEPFGPPTSVVRSPVVSPDGSRVALRILEESTTELEVLDLSRNVITKLTFGEDAGAPLWTPDGATLVYLGGGPGADDLFRKRADGASPSEFVFGSPDPDIPNDISRDGETLIYNQIHPDGTSDLMRISLTEPGAAPNALLDSRFDERSARLSPDGKWIAYQSDESGHREIFVRSYPDMGGKWQVSAKGGEAALWAPDGSAIYFRKGRQVLAADVQTDPYFKSSAPRVLFEADYFSSFGRDWDIHPDGTRFVMIKDLGATEGDALALKAVTNWTAELKRLVPAGKGK